MPVWVFWNDQGNPMDESGLRKAMPRALKAYLVLLFIREFTHEDFFQSGRYGQADHSSGVHKIPLWGNGAYEPSPL